MKEKILFSSIINAQIPKIAIMLSHIDRVGKRLSTDADEKSTPDVLPCTGTRPLSIAIGVAMRNITAINIKNALPLKNRFIDSSFINMLRF